MIEVPTLGQVISQTKAEAPVEEVKEEAKEEPKVEEKPKKAKKEKKEKAPKIKVKCKVRRAQKVWWLLLVLVAAAAAAIYFLVPSLLAPVLPYVDTLVKALMDINCNTWTPLASVAVFGTVALAVLDVTNVNKLAAVRGTPPIVQFSKVTESKT